MYSNRLKNSSRNLRTFRSLEKLSYALLIPSVSLYFGYRFYKNNIMEVEERAMQVQAAEEKFSA